LYGIPTLAMSYISLPSNFSHTSSTLAMKAGDALGTVLFLLGVVGSLDVDPGDEGLQVRMSYGRLSLHANPNCR
jgi:hypothetical protein